MYESKCYEGVCGLKLRGIIFEAGVGVSLRPLAISYRQRHVLSLTQAPRVAHKLHGTQLS